MTTAAAAAAGFGIMWREWYAIGNPTDQSSAVATLILGVSTASPWVKQQTAVSCTDMSCSPWLYGIFES
jgi:hypothetical protein